MENNLRKLNLVSEMHLTHLRSTLLVLNGACEGDCEPVGPGKSYPVSRKKGILLRFDRALKRIASLTCRSGFSNSHTERI